MVPWSEIDVGTSFTSAKVYGQNDGWSVEESNTVWVQLWDSLTKLQVADKAKGGLRVRLCQSLGAR